MRRFLSPVLGLELLAFALVALQAFQGISTDEAKYLLNIPYPHPPLLRWIMGIALWVPGQALLWRLILATALLQAVWIVVSLLPEQNRSERLTIGALWILSASVLTLSGAILMAPVTALQALLFCWLLLKGEELERRVGWIALLWLASLFTAYQALFFLPVVAVVFWRMRLPAWQRILCIVGPMVLLLLYSATNPLAVASMVTASEQNAGRGTFLDAARGVLWLWLLGGSVVLSLLGTLGMLSARRWSLLLSLLLTAAFILVSYRPYYGILFTPLFVAGLAASPHLLKWRALTLTATVLCALVLVPNAFPPPLISSASQVFSRAQASHVPTGATALIAGSFGHEWQYGPYVVRRMVPNPQLLDSARVVVCLADCPEVRGKKTWKRLTGVPVEAWVRPVGS
jgi:hypothetical protein